MMRGLWFIAIVLLPACAQEAPFDERFEETEAKIERKVEELERELAQPPDQDDVSATGNRSAGSEGR